MKAFEAIAVTASMLVGVPLAAYAQAPAQPLPFEKLAAECASDVHPSTLKGVVTTQSLRSSPLTTNLLPSDRYSCISSHELLGMVQCHLPTKSPSRVSPNSVRAAEALILAHNKMMVNIERGMHALTLKRTGA
jgi:hypothetical protein